MGEKKTITITDAVRHSGTEEDRIEFKPGVNTLVGLPNTGKSKWMETIDFLLGDAITAEQRETDDIFVKFDSARLTATIGGDNYEVERKWKEKGSLGKVFVNGQTLALEEYQSLLLKQLGIAPFHYPQGNPYGPRSWPELGWRSLVRHMYRRQRMWSDLADKQPVSEQHACLLQFLGIAERTFSSDLESLIDKQKQITTMEAQRRNFIETLQEISRELTDTEELSVALTPQSLSEADDRLAKEEDQLRADRARLLADLATEVAANSPAVSNGMEDLTERLVSLEAEKGSGFAALQRVLERKGELDEYRRVLSQELKRLERAVEAGNAFADLKVTHCPACDRDVHKSDSSADQCYVCKQPLLSATRSGAERIQFELEQLRSEADEMDELLSRLATEIDAQQQRLEVLREKIVHTQQLLRPARMVAAAILPPELGIADMSLGRLQEKRHQLERIKSSLGRRETLAKQIKDIQAEIDVLNNSVIHQTRGVDYQLVADRLSDGMNTYLNKLNKAHKDAWVVGDVAFEIGDRTFKIRVGKANWQTKLGGTLTLYFLLAYHYALMDLVRFPESHFPGLLLIDFPAEMEGATIADKENFVIEPFIDLMAQDGMQNCQMIAAGSSFAGLEGAKRISLSHIWKPL